MSKKLARIRINVEFMAESLHLPKTTRIVDLYPTSELGVFEIKVEDETLKPIENGQLIPIITPIYKRQPPIVCDLNQKPE